MRMYGALIFNVASFFLEDANSNKSLIWRAGSQNPNNHLCKICSDFGKSIILLFFLLNTVVFKPHSSYLEVQWGQDVRVLEFSKAYGLFLFLCRDAFLPTQRNPCSFWRQSVGERESANPQSKLQLLLLSCTASEKHTEITLLHDHAQTSWPSSSWNTVKGKSHGIPARQYGHKRKSAQLWLAWTKGRGQTVGHQSHIHKRWSPGLQSTAENHMTDTRQPGLKEPRKTYNHN